MRNAIVVLGLFSLTMPYAVAGNSVTIDQVGAGTVDVKQNGKNNSANINQKNIEEQLEKNEKEREIKNKNRNAAIKQPAYLSFGEQARVNSVIHQQIPPSNEEKTNKISVQQKGQDNSAKLSQTGNDNELILKQEGENNFYERSQKGKHKRSKIIQNGNTTENMDEGNE